MDSFHQWLDNLLRVTGAFGGPSPRWNPLLVLKIKSVPLHCDYALYYREVHYLSSFGGDSPVIWFNAHPGEDIVALLPSRVLGFVGETRMAPPLTLTLPLV
jgi:hypothetical protein